MHSQLLKDGGKRANIYLIIEKKVKLTYESHYAYIKYAVRQDVYHVANIFEFSIYGEKVLLRIQCISFCCT